MARLSFGNVEENESYPVFFYQSSSGSHIVPSWHHKRVDVRSSFYWPRGENKLCAGTEESEVIL